MAAIYADMHPIYAQQDTDINRHNIVTQDNNAETLAFIREDFVVIAEFSEVTGPIPLLTIPSHIANDKTFDINHYIMKIMSVDYQANPSSHFQTCHDVQMLTSEPGQNAYVHYTMLHDLQARGWVRPLCIAYVTSDSQKLQKNFNSYREMFLKMTQIMKHNNCHWFKEELLKVLQTLKEAQGKYFCLKQREVDGLCLSNDDQITINTIDIDLMVHQYTEYKNLLHAVEPLLDNADSQKIVDAWKEGLILAEANISQITCYLNKHQQEMDMSNESPKKENGLKTILALCPWGFAATIWSLLSILQFQSQSKLDYGFAAFASELKHIKTKTTVDAALSNTEFLNLLATSTRPLSQIGSEAEIHTFSSANEASSSYHSAPDSISELPRDLDQYSDCESYVDVSETLHTDDSCSESDDEVAHLGPNLWNSSSPSMLTGQRLLKFFRGYDRVACHVLYSLLIGRTVVISGTEVSRRKVAQLIVTLRHLVPVFEYNLLNVLTWHCGILVSSHITNHQLIGLCVPERLSIHDMMNPKDKNSISILDIETKQLFGPAYSGQLLSSLDKVVTNVTSDRGIQLHLRSVAAVIDEKVFMLKFLLSNNQTDKTKQVLRLQGCDVDIIKYFNKFRT